MDESPDLFPTSQTELAAALHALGHEVVTMGKEDREGKRIQFMFWETDELKDDVTDFFAKRLMIEPMRYFVSIKKIKELLYQFRADDKYGQNKV